MHSQLSEVFTRAGAQAVECGKGFGAIIVDGVKLTAGVRRLTDDERHDLHFGCGFYSVLLSADAMAAERTGGPVGADLDRLLNEQGYAAESLLQDGEGWRAPFRDPRWSIDWDQTAGGDPKSPHLITRKRHRVSLMLICDWSAGLKNA